MLDYVSKESVDFMTTFGGEEKSIEKNFHGRTVSVRGITVKTVWCTILNRVWDRRKKQYQTVAHMAFVAQKPWDNKPLEGNDMELLYGDAKAKAMIEPAIVMNFGHIKPSDDLQKTINSMLASYMAVSEDGKHLAKAFVMTDEELSAADDARARIYNYELCKSTKHTA